MMNTQSNTGPGSPPLKAGVKNWVHEELDSDQLSSGKQSYGRRKLGTGTLVLFWGLRIYVLIMILLVGLQVWNALKPGK